VGRRLWIALLAAIVAVGIAGGALDLALYLTVGYDATITAFLRVHSAYFWWPAALVILFVACLIFHLYFEPKL